MPSAQGRWESAVPDLFSLPWILPFCWERLLGPGVGREQSSVCGERGGRRPKTQAAQMTFGSDSLAAMLKDLKTLALRPLRPPRGFRRPSRSPHCPTWPSGSLLSLDGTCSQSPALPCLQRAPGMSSFHP